MKLDTSYCIFNASNVDRVNFLNFQLFLKSHMAQNVDTNSYLSEAVCLITIARDLASIL